ncbi:hypothetical protein CVT24_010238 [Panaeolus cyanescens]|uniref:Uncharacterized protein n=1 Tax=Panaeolus cyanescens TaxID=181874 RepID=A0A409WMN9_9AGAR|nr:hypothetical protein CVT24_010238 [Panaeolus cyanescens]
MPINSSDIDDPARDNAFSAKLRDLKLYFGQEQDVINQKLQDMQQQVSDHYLRSQRKLKEVATRQEQADEHFTSTIADFSDRLNAVEMHQRIVQSRESREKVHSDRSRAVPDGAAWTHDLTEKVQGLSKHVEKLERRADTLQDAIYATNELVLRTEDKIEEVEDQLKQGLMDVHQVLTHLESGAEERDEIQYQYEADPNSEASLNTTLTSPSLADELQKVDHHGSSALLAVSKGVEEDVNLSSGTGSSDLNSLHLVEESDNLDEVSQPLGVAPDDKVHDGGWKAFQRLSFIIIASIQPGSLNRRLRMFSIADTITQLGSYILALGIQTHLGIPATIVLGYLRHLIQMPHSLPLDHLRCYVLRFWNLGIVIVFLAVATIYLVHSPENSVSVGRRASPPGPRARRYERITGMQPHAYNRSS